MRSVLIFPAPASSFSSRHHLSIRIKSTSSSGIQTRLNPLSGLFIIRKKSARLPFPSESRRYDNISSFPSSVFSFPFRQAQGMFSLPSTARTFSASRFVRQRIAKSSKPRLLFSSFRFRILMAKYRYSSVTSVKALIRISPVSSFIAAGFFKSLSLFSEIILPASRTISFPER